MLLNEFALCYYLLENGFLKHEQVVNGQVKISRHFFRNRNFRVSLNDGNGFLVKQPKLSFYQKKSALKKEADIYWLANNDEDFKSTLDFIPEFFHYDSDVQVLITGLVEPSINLHEYHASLNNFPEAIAEKQAIILSAMHQVTLRQIENKKSRS